jgi:hypothetical protein
MDVIKKQFKKVGKHGKNNQCQIFTWRNQAFGKGGVLGRRRIYCHH